MANTKFFISFVQTLKKKLKSALVARFDSILTDNGATVVESKDWEKASSCIRNPRFP